MSHDALLGLGSNLGDRAAIIDAALVRLGATMGIDLVETSPLIETKPIGGPPGQGLYLNGVAHIRTSLAPLELLAATSAIETQLGRTRTTPWGARRIDIDILLYGDVVWTSSTLTIPHPLMTVRRFVLEPASMLPSEWHHPTLGKTLREILAEM
ncbi:MAG: 2-amino-4-hydroxy-6-hydroxymethyldihydropteridine diphosphokinase [Thermoguttaceae bacterium]